MSRGGRRHISDALRRVLSSYGRTLGYNWGWVLICLGSVSNKNFRLVAQNCPENFTCPQANLTGPAQVLATRRDWPTISIKHCSGSVVVPRRQWWSYYLILCHLPGLHWVKSYHTNICNFTVWLHWLDLNSDSVMQGWPWPLLLGVLILVLLNLY